MFRLDFKVILKGQRSKLWHSTHLQKMDFLPSEAWHSCVYLILYVLPLKLTCQFQLSSDGLHCSLDVSTWTMTSSSLWVRSDGQSTTWWILTYSKDHFYCAISTRMTSAASLCLHIAVLHSLSHIPSHASSFHTNCTTNDFYWK